MVCLFIYFFPTSERTNQTTFTSGRQSILHSPPPLRNLPLSPRRQKRRRRVVLRARRVPNRRWGRFNWDARYVNLCSPSLCPSPSCARVCAPLSKFEISHSNSNVSPTEFPRSPTGIIRQHIAYGADARLKFYLPLSRSGNSSSSSGSRGSRWWRDRGCLRGWWIRRW